MKTIQYNYDILLKFDVFFRYAKNQEFGNHSRFDNNMMQIIFDSIL